MAFTTNQRTNRASAPISSGVKNSDNSKTAKIDDNKNDHEGAEHGKNQDGDKSKSQYAQAPEPTTEPVPVSDVVPSYDTSSFPTTWTTQSSGPADRLGVPFERTYLGMIPAEVRGLILDEALNFGYWVDLTIPIYHKDEPCRHYRDLYKNHMNETTRRNLRSVCRQLRTEAMESFIRTNDFLAVWLTSVCRIPKLFGIEHTQNIMSFELVIYFSMDRQKQLWSPMLDFLGEHMPRLK